MPIPVTCPKCDRQINAPDTLAGERVKCPGCGVPIVIPKPFTAGGPLGVATPAIQLPPATTKPAAIVPTHVVITDVQIPFDRAVFLVGFWWAASLVFGVILGIIIGVGLMVLAAILRGAAG